MNTSDDFLKLYNKEYHESHLNWAKKDNRIFKHYRKNYLELVQIKKPIKILEIGCSSGKTSLELAKAGASIIAVDFDKNAIDLARKYTQENGLGNQVEFVNISADDPSLMEKTFDLVTMLDFVEHVPDRVLLNLIENLREKKFTGDICVYTPNKLHFTELLRECGILQQDPTHINLKSFQQWVDFFKNQNLEITFCKRTTSHWPVLKEIESIFKSIPYLGNLLTRSISLRCRVPKDR